MKENMPKTSICMLTGVSVLAIGLASASAQEAKEIGIPDSEYSLEALIEAAKKESPITVIDATGKIVSMAENFSKKYGLQAAGVKMSGQDQEQVIAREAAAGNVRTDVFNMSNLPSVTSQILPQGFGISWLAPDLKDKIPAEYQSPAITSNNPWVFAYNTDVNGETCPVDNLWALTTEEWKGRVAIPDPLLRNETMFWFNQLAVHGDAAMREGLQGAVRRGEDGRGERHGRMGQAPCPEQAEGHQERQRRWTDRRREGGEATDRLPQCGHLPRREEGRLWHGHLQGDEALDRPADPAPRSVGRQPKWSSV